MDSTTQNDLTTVEGWHSLFSEPFDKHALFKHWQIAQPLTDKPTFDAFHTWCHAFDKHTHQGLIQFNILAPALFMAHSKVHWSEWESLFPEVGQNGLFMLRNGGPQRALLALCNVYKSRSPNDDAETKSRYRVLATLMEMFAERHWDQMTGFSPHNPRMYTIAFLKDVAPENLELWNVLGGLDGGYDYIVQSLVEMAQPTYETKPSVEMPSTF